MRFVNLFALIGLLLNCAAVSLSGSIFDDENIDQQQQQPIDGGNNADFEIVNEWKYLDFEYPTYVQRQQAIAQRAFIPENNLPLGIAAFQNRVFITTPRWKDGVPASIGTLPYPAKERSPAILPYPNWDEHGDPYSPDCTKLMSVYRISVDKCARLWLIDSGIVNATVNLNQICPPKIVIYDLRTDKRLMSYEMPAPQVKQDSLHSNIVVDIVDEDCQNAYAYVTDVWRFGVIVYSLTKNRSWRVRNYNFAANPDASVFDIYGLNFQWLDGVFGMSVSANALLYYHPMASLKEYVVSTQLLQNETLWSQDSALDLTRYFFEIGDRGKYGQSSTSGIARNGVMFYTQVHRDNVACWDTSKPYNRANLHLLLDSQKNNSNALKLIQFPNDLKIDDEIDQSIWVMSNKLPIYLYSRLDYETINFRILKARVKDIIANTICEPGRKSRISSKTVIVSIEEGQCY